MRTRLYTLLTVGLMSLAMMGCTRSDSVLPWMAGGAIPGAVIGGWWADQAATNALNTAQGAVIGGVTGAAVGALVGDLVMDDEPVVDDGAAAERDRLRAELARLQAELDAAKKENETLRARIAELEKQGGGGRQVEMQVELLADVLFEPGSARLSQRGRQILTETASKIKSQYANRYVTVQGHTDSQPIRYSSWKDNWELGSARALAVLRHLIEQGISPERSSAETFSMYRPVSQGTSPDAMRQNRRAVIVVHSGWMTSEQGASMSSEGTSRPAANRPAAAGQARQR